MIWLPDVPIPLSSEPGPLPTWVTPPVLFAQLAKARIIRREVKTANTRQPNTDFIVLLLKDCLSEHRVVSASFRLHTRSATNSCEFSQKTTNDGFPQYFGGQPDVSPRCGGREDGRRF